MLIDFKVKNFRSFYEKSDGSPIFFSMCAGKVRNKKEHTFEEGDNKILKFAAIYGANASGKSNFVRALSFMRHVVLRGTSRMNPYEYCKAKPYSAERDSFFEVKLAIKGHEYRYGFKVQINSGSICEEWLLVKSDGGDYKKIFSRDVRGKSHDIPLEQFSEEIGPKLDIYITDIDEENSILFLSVMNQNKKSLYDTGDDYKLNMFRDVYQWFMKGLVIHYPAQDLLDYQYLLRAGNLDKVGKLLYFFDTGIKSLRIIEVPMEQPLEQLPSRVRMEVQKDLSKALQDAENHSLIMRGNNQFYIFEINKDEIKCKTIKFEHDIENVLFNLSEESDGTVRLLDLLEILLMGEHRTYVVDEFDRCLHPLLSIEFIRKFLELAEERNIQLIITTLEQSLLDLDIVRRDEIWGVEKETGISSLFSFESKKIRFDKKVDKEYMRRTYGATPYFVEDFF